MNMNHEYTIATDDCRALSSQFIKYKVGIREEYSTYTLSTVKAMMKAPADNNEKHRLSPLK